MAKKIQVELAVKDKGTAQVKKFSDNASGMLKKLAGPAAAGAVVAVFTKMATQFLKVGDQLDKMSQRTGFSVEQLDKLRQAASLGGTSIENIEKAVRRLQKNLVDASKGTGLASESLEDMGINIDKLLKLNPEQQFQAIAQQLLKIEDPTVRAARAQELLGISGTNLIPVLRDVAGGLTNYNAQVTKEQADDVAAFNDAVARTKFAFEGLAAKWIGPVVDKLVAYVEITRAYTNLEPYIEIDKLNDRLREQKAVLEEIGPAVKGQIDRQKMERDNVLAGIKATEEQIAALQKEIDERENRAKVAKAEIPVLGKSKNATEKEKEEINKATEALKKNAEARQAAIDKIRAQVEATEAAAQSIRDQRRTELTDGEGSEFEAFLFPDIPDVQEEKTTERYNHEAEMQRMHIEDMLERDRRYAAERQQIYDTMTSTISNGIVDAMFAAAEGTKSYKEAFTDMAIEVLKQLAKIVLLLAIKRALEGAFGGGASGLSAGGQVPYIPAMADGGILKGGFKKFAAGGVVGRPTLGLVGEGAMNEAIVPLPDGKSIPVDMKGDENQSPSYNFMIQAVDAPSLVNLLRRNPEAIIRPLTEQIERGNQGLRQNLKRAVNR